MKNILSCIVCDAELEASDATQEGTNQPYAGTAFETTGHYGSTVFDPMMGDREYLEIAICDPCLIEKRNKVLHGHKIVKREDRTMPWHPSREVLEQYE